jgi:hypothetical protein
MILAYRPRGVDKEEEVCAWVGGWAVVVAMAVVVAAAAAVVVVMVEEKIYIFLYPRPDKRISRFAMAAATAFRALE